MLLFCPAESLGKCSPFLAFIANYTIPYNYMFLRSDDGTPYFIVTKIVGGNKVLYPIGVIMLFVIYIFAFYGIYFLCTKKSRKA